MSESSAGTALSRRLTVPSCLMIAMRRRACWLSSRSGVKQGLGNGLPGLIKQRPERHGAKLLRLQHFRHAAEFGLFHRTDHEPARDQGPTRTAAVSRATFHRRPGSCRNIRLAVCARGLIEMMASSRKREFLFDFGAWNIHRAVVP